MGIYVERAMNFWSTTLADERNTGARVCVCVSVCGKLYKGDLANGFLFPQNQGALRTPQTAELCKASSTGNPPCTVQPSDRLG